MTLTVTRPFYSVHLYIKVREAMQRSDKLVTMKKSFPCIPQYSVCTEEGTEGNIFV